MANKFLNPASDINLSNGTATLFGATLGAVNLEPSYPLRTNSVKQLVSEKLNITDITNLRSELDNKNELTFVENDSHTNPSSGQVKIYAKTDGEMYKLNSLGEETVLGGSQEKLILVESTTGIDYSEDVELFTYSDNTLNTHNFYDYTSTPNKPELRPAYEPTDAPTNVASEAELDTAISTEARNIVITTTLTITTQKVIEHSCKISQSSGITIVSNVDIPFVIIGDNITIDGLEIINNRTNSVVSCLKFENVEAINNTVRNCIFSTNEFGIGSDNAQIQIHNCAFLFIGIPDQNRYIQLTKTTGETLIYSNTFQSNQSLQPNTGCLLLNGTASNYKDGSLIVYNNASTDGTIQRMGIMETVPESNFTLSFIQNTIETNTDFWIIYVGSNPLAGFKEIILHNNEVSLMAGSAGFKGLIGIDSFTSGISIDTPTIIRASQNTLPLSLRVDYTLIAQSSASNPLMMYSTAKFSLNIPSILVNPPLVSYYEPPPEGGDVFGPASSVDSAVAFFDGTSGKVLRQNPVVNFSGNTLIVPDLETDTTFSLNDELQKISNIDSATQSPDITNFNGEIHVAKIKSASHNTELEFETLGSAILTSDADIQLVSGSGDIELNGNSITLACPSNALTYNGDNVKFLITDNLNTFGGIDSGVNLTTGQDNTAYGYQSLLGLNNGGFNVAVGSQALKANVNGNENVAVGEKALTKNQGGINNVAIGAKALTNNVSGISNVAIGKDALLASTASNNTAVGANALRMTTASYNTALGSGAAPLITTGDNNTAIGFACVSNLTTGENNTVVGSNSLKLNTGGVDNTCVGYNSLYNSTASSNTAVGKDSMFNNTTGGGNVAMGQGTLSGNQTGADNTFIGRAAGNVGNTISESVGVGAESLQQNTNSSTCVGVRAGQNLTGLYNTAVGHESLQSTTGNQNSALGRLSLNANTTGASNTACGETSGSNNTTGNFNTFIGRGSGEQIATGNYITNVGYRARANAGLNPTNSTSLGANSIITASNQIVLGDSAITEIVSGSNGTCDLGSSSKKFDNIYGTKYNEGTYSGLLIKKIPIGSGNIFTDDVNPPGSFATGDYNVLIGASAGTFAVDANRNVCVGVSTMGRGTSATREFNTCIGHNAGIGETTSTFTNTTLLGAYAGENLTTDNGNTFVGASAGRSQTTGANNTLIGYLSNTSGNNKTNSIAIGYAATALNDNQCCIGNTLIEKIYNEGNGTCDLGAATRRFKDLHLAGNIYGLAKNSVNNSNAGDVDLYNDGTLRIWLDDTTTDDIEFEITTPPEYITTAKTYHQSATSFKGTTTSSGAIALAGTATVNYTVDFDFQTDEVMIIRLWSPTIGATWGFYEITCVNTYSVDFTGQPVLCSVKRLL